MTTSETCAKCGQPTVAAHSISLDGTRGYWRLCCLCAAELVQQLNAAPAAQP